MSANVTIGLYAALTASLAHGTFTVPMKGKAANSVNIDPFVFQTYKTTMCFLTCWLGLLWGTKFVFTPWGMVAGLLWVIGGTMGIFAVRNAGIAVSVGTWSAVTVLVSYVWGILIFEEKVYSELDTFLSILLLAVGLVGMSWATSPSNDVTSSPTAEELPREDESATSLSSLREPLVEVEFVEQDRTLAVDGSSSSSSLHDTTAASCDKESDNGPPDHGPRSDSFIRLFRRDISRRRLGICGAALNGLFSGSSMIPLHFVREEEKGLSFVISFAIGASIVCVSFWILRYLLLVVQHKSCATAWGELPSFHLKIMLVPGCTAGFIWSLGNLGNVLAVTNLGNGIGLSLCQGQLVISGLWGIFFYKEIQDTRKIMLWFGAASVALFAIYKLVQEHE